MEAKTTKGKTIMKKIGGGLYKHSSIILMGTTISAGLSAVVLSVRSTTKAKKLLDEAPVEELYNSETGKMDKKYVIKKCWKAYVPTLIATTIFVASAVLAHVTNERKAKAISKALAATTSMLSLYEEQVKEHVGEDKAQEIKESIGQKIIDKNDVGNEYENTDAFEPGQVVCYDPLIGREFPSDRETIRKAVNDINEMIVHSDWASVNDFYYFLGLDSVKLGNDLGWNTEHMLNITFDSCLSKKGIPCLVLVYNVEPRRLYEYDS